MLSIWDERIWLPEDVEWSDLKSNATATYPAPRDLVYSIIGGGILLIIRILLESFVFLPIGWAMGFMQRPLFQAMYQHLTGGFSGKGKFKRVAECAWRATFYISAWIVGLVILSSKDYFWDVTYCWRNWPYHNIPNSIWWYYMSETSFYWALLIGTIFIDVKRADFWQMTLHHAITIGLLFISWSMNMVRVGTLILFSHDAADIILEIAKIVRYANWDRLLEILFVVLFLVWVGTRLVYYPFVILKSIWFDAPALIKSSYKWSNFAQRPLMPRVLMVLLTLLLLLHLFWTFILIKVAYNSTREGKLDDVREDDSDEEVDETTIAKKKE
ncbi:hypothetical protein WR25_12533 [Diploscapter pachys]|uniref:TLC domain-containing protein n=1 Tax=Diploscapter pachys TaxID=2018661 RepID=A0A2A2JUU9_9BILA|nr:hypothetical protein WR25_12533 [Diploscapter pachys]